jgi:hypothetical protein
MPLPSWASASQYLAAIEQSRGNIADASQNARNGCSEDEFCAKCQSLTVFVKISAFCLGMAGRLERNL